MRTITYSTLIFKSSSYFKSIAVIKIDLVSMQLKFSHCYKVLNIFDGSAEMLEYNTTKHTVYFYNSIVQISILQQKLLMQINLILMQLLCILLEVNIPCTDCSTVKYVQGE